MTNTPTVKEALADGRIAQLEEIDRKIRARHFNGSTLKARDLATTEPTPERLGRYGVGPGVVASVAARAQAKQDLLQIEKRLLRLRGSRSDFGIGKLLLVALISAAIVAGTILIFMKPILLLPLGLLVVIGQILDSRSHT